MTDSIQALAEKINEVCKELPPHLPIAGCSAADVRKIENGYKLELPAKYKEFLHVIGRECPYLFDECLAHYPYMFWFRKSAKSDFADAGVRLGAKRFAFCEREGQYLFFDAGNTDDPRVFNMEFDHVVDTEMSFSEWLQLTVSDRINELLECKDLSWDRYNDRCADPKRRAKWEQSAAFLCHRGDVVRVAKDLKEIECWLQKKEIRVKKGTIAQVYSTQNFDGSNSCYLEVVDESGFNLLSLPEVVEDNLELVSSENRFVQNPTWEDYRADW